MGYPKILATLILGIGLVFSGSVYGESLNSRLTDRQITFYFDCASPDIMGEVNSVDDEFGSLVAWNWFSKRITESKCTLYRQGKSFQIVEVLSIYEYANPAANGQLAYLLKLQDTNGNISYSLTIPKTFDKLFPPNPEA